MAGALEGLLDTPLEVFVVVLNVCMASAIVLANGLLIAALLNARALLRHNNYVFMLSLTASDLLVGAGWFYNGVFDVRDNWGPAYGPSNMFPTIHGISLLTMLASMLDRYYAVASPFGYTLRATRPRVLAVVGVLWLWPLLTALAMSFAKVGDAHAYQGYTTIAVTVCLVVVMTVVNLRLYFITRKQLSREPCNDGESKARSARLIIVASTVFIAFWLPCLVASCLCGSFGVCLPVRRNSLSPMNFIRIINTLSSPVIFLVGSPRLKVSVGELARRALCQRSVHPKPGGGEKDEGGSGVAVILH